MTNKIQPENDISNFIERYMDIYAQSDPTQYTRGRCKCTVLYHTVA